MILAGPSQAAKGKRVHIQGVDGSGSRDSETIVRISVVLGKISSTMTDAIVTIETPVRDDAKGRVNRYMALLRVKYLRMEIEVEQRYSLDYSRCGGFFQSLSKVYSELATD